MRMFWAMVAALAVVTGLLWAMSPNGGDQQFASRDQPMTSGEDPIIPRGRSAESAPAPRDLRGEASAGSPADDDAAVSHGDAEGEELSQSPDAADQADRDMDPEAEALLDELVDDFERRAAEAGPALEGFDDDGPELPRAYRDDDGGFILEGDGSESDPYRVTWDMLLSAAESYAPRMGKTELPQHIKKLDEAHVEITGYLAFPTAGENTDELLVMLNEWDGCCLGVPPSPYDAVEVRLAAPVMASRSMHEAQYGTVRGRMNVDPYVIDDWLLGLYLMEEASVSIGM